jgi:hypothetical protein
MATAASNIIIIIWIIIIIIIIILFISIILFPINLIIKCPAIILAVNRTASDPGRIKFLVVSIITINGISILGVPVGIRWANISFVLLYHPNNIKDNHNGIAIVKFNVIWLVLVKM